MARRLHNLPGHHYEKVQAVPRVSKVTLLAENPQSHHLDHHLNGKERKDEVIKVLQRRKRKRTDFVLLSMGSHKTPSSLEPVLSNQKTPLYPANPSPPRRSASTVCSSKGKIVLNGEFLVMSQREEASVLPSLSPVQNVQTVRNDQLWYKNTQNLLNTHSSSAKF